jgi:hydroxymethylpyrimidine pyrophosphatase-like HAD family hydrolase
VHAQGHTLAHTSFVGADATRLRAALRDAPIRAFLFDRDTIVHDDEGAPYLDYVRTWSPQLERAGQVLEHHSWKHEQGVTAVVGIATEAHVSAFVDTVNAQLAHAAQVISFPFAKTGLWGFLVRSRHCDKGTALHWLAARAGVAREATVAVGDWINDVPMFRAAGRAFAMGQAPDEVKAAATTVLTETAETGGGIATVVRELFGVRF